MSNLQKWFAAWMVFTFIMVVTSNFFVEAITVGITIVLVTKLEKRRNRSIRR